MTRSSIRMALDGEGQDPFLLLAHGHVKLIQVWKSEISAYLRGDELLNLETIVTRIYHDNFFRRDLQYAALLRESKLRPYDGAPGM